MATIGAAILVKTDHYQNSDRVFPGQSPLPSGDAHRRAMLQPLAHRVAVASASSSSKAAAFVHSARILPPAEGSARPLPPRSCLGYGLVTFHLKNGTVRGYYGVQHHACCARRCACHSSAWLERCVRSAGATALPSLSASAALALDHSCDEYGLVSKRFDFVVRDTNPTGAVHVWCGKQRYRTS